MEKLILVTASHRFSASGLRLGQVTVSLGVTESEGEEAPKDILRQADAELYTAKRDGRNRVAVCAPRRPQRVGI